MDSLLKLQQQVGILRGFHPKKKKGLVRAAKQQRLDSLKELRNRYSSKDSFYSSDAWLKIRYRVIQKNGRRCQACGADGRELRYHVDHIKPRSRFPELQFLESNLQVLCEPCNLGKGNVDETDWRTK